MVGSSSDVFFVKEERREGSTKASPTKPQPSSGAASVGKSIAEAILIDDSSSDDDRKARRTKDWSATGRTAHKAAQPSRPSSQSATKRDTSRGLIDVDDDDDDDGDDDDDMPTMTMLWSRRRNRSGTGSSSRASSSPSSRTHRNGKVPLLSQLKANLARRDFNNENKRRTSPRLEAKAGSRNVKEEPSKTDKSNSRDQQARPLRDRSSSLQSSQAVEDERLRSGREPSVARTSGLAAESSPQVAASAAALPVPSLAFSRGSRPRTAPSTPRSPTWMLSPSNHKRPSTMGSSPSITREQYERELVAPEARNSLRPRAPELEVTPHGPPLEDVGQHSPAQQPVSEGHENGSNSASSSLTPDAFQTPPMGDDSPSHPQESQIAGTQAAIGPATMGNVVADQTVPEQLAVPTHPQQFAGHHLPSVPYIPSTYHPQHTPAYDGHIILGQPRLPPVAGNGNDPVQPGNPPSAETTIPDAKVLQDLANGNPEGNPDALRSLFEGDSERVADMANLKPCSEAALARLRLAGLKTELKPHQSTGLKFLVDSEHRKLPSPEDKDPVCLWKAWRRFGKIVWVNEATQEYIQEEPQLPRGSILADAMGLGKTLMILALMLTPEDGAGIVEGTSSDDDVDDARPPDGSSTGAAAAGEQKASDDIVFTGRSQSTRGPSRSTGRSSHAFRTSPSSPSRKKQKIAHKPAHPGSSSRRPDSKHYRAKSGRPLAVADSDEDEMDWSSEEYELDSTSTDEALQQYKKAKKSRFRGQEVSVKRASAPTLIVCPLSVLSNWVDQAKQHTTMRYAILYGPDAKRLRAEKDWNKYDFIVTTYDSLKSAHKEIALLKLHEFRESDYRERRKELEEAIDINERQWRQTSAAWCQANLSALREQLKLVKHNWANEWFVTPKKPGRDGRTDWKKQDACLKRYEKLAFNGLSRGRRTRPEEFTQAELLYIWANVGQKADRDDVTRVFKQQWLRVVLDEAHVARNRNTATFAAIAALQAERKHAVTGTPLINSTHDLGALASFIGVEPFNNHGNGKMWSTYIDLPIKAQNGIGLRLLRSITKSLVCLRTKEMRIDGKPLVELPAVERRTFQIALNKSDQDFYARAETALREKITSWMQEGEMSQRASSILMFLTRMRQLACHRSLVPTTLLEDIEMAGVDEPRPGQDRPPAQLRKILEAAVINQETCPECSEVLTLETKPVITPCGHWFHSECITAALATARVCPTDRRAMPTDAVLVALPEQLGEEVEDGGHGDSAKVDALVNLLNDIYSRDPREKVLVFSNFVQFLKLIAKRLTSEEIPFVEFFGSHSRTQREETLKEFRKPFPADAYFAPPKVKKEASKSGQPKATNRVHERVRSSRADDDGASSAMSSGAESGGSTLLRQIDGALTDGFEIFRPKGSAEKRPIPRVLLISIGAGSVGLNLTAANHVILSDPWWQGALESQAADRCHRIGQMREVYIYHLVSASTVEDRVVQIAKEKTELAAQALGGVQYQGSALWKAKDSQRAKLGDIARIFGLNTGNSGGPWSGGGGNGPMPIRQAGLPRPTASGRRRGSDETDEDAEAANDNGSDLDGFVVPDDYESEGDAGESLSKKATKKKRQHRRSSSGAGEGEASRPRRSLRVVSDEDVD